MELPQENCSKVGGGSCRMCGPAAACSLVTLQEFLVVLSGRLDCPAVVPPQAPAAVAAPPQVVGRLQSNQDRPKRGCRTLTRPLLPCMLTCTFQQGPQILLLRVPRLYSVSVGGGVPALPEADPPFLSCCCCLALRLPAAMSSACSPVCSRSAQHGMGAAAAHHSKPGAPAAVGPAQTAQTSRPGGGGAAAGLGLHAPAQQRGCLDTATKAPAGVGAPPTPTLPVTQQLWLAGVCHPQGLLQSAKPPCCCIDTFSIYLSPDCADC